MDPRVEPNQFLGPGWFGGVLKNAGGRATPDVVRSILTLRSLSLTSKKGTVAVIHHTGKQFPVAGRTNDHEGISCRVPVMTYGDQTVA